MQTILPASAFSKWLTGCRGNARVASRHSCELPLRKALTFQLPAGSRILCVRGRVWITCDGTAEDIVLSAGRFHEFPRGGRLVAEGLESSLLEIGRG